MGKLVKKTARDLLIGNGEGFDPLNYDTTAIRELSNAIPRNASIDTNQAEILATKFLRGADLCSELMAIAFAYMSKCETLKKKSYSNAALIKSATAGIKTDKARCLFAEADDEYIEAANRYTEAMAFFKWVSSKYESFNKGHYLCKHILTREYMHEKSANGAIESDKLYEVNQDLLEEDPSDSETW